ncbi:MAG: polysaccharide deacetylase family protein [Candidatus Aminicenantes bacterium]|nr:polysaccharide deacetylase family protein [Candidatus Aminicenantes bacterium]
MKKKIILVPLMFLVFCMLVWSQEALIIYDGTKKASESYKSACYIKELLGHFPLNGKKIVHVAEYDREKIRSTDYVFIVFEEGVPKLPRFFIDDLLRARGTLAWIHMHIEKLVDVAISRWGIYHNSIEYRRQWQISYKEHKILKQDLVLNAMFIRDKEKVGVLSWARDLKGNKFPYVLHTQNLWYFADTPFSSTLEEGRYLIFTDVLHEILETKMTKKHKCLVRVEDISPESEPGQLRKLADFFKEEKIPFQVGVIPIFKDPQAQQEIDLFERPEVVKALKYMVSQGGTLVMHGITHQYRGRSGSDYEFWDHIRDEPLLHGSSDWGDLRIVRGILAFRDNGLYPLCWETPHYAASTKDYLSIAKYFDTFYDRMITTEDKVLQIFPFPYPIFQEKLGVRIIPENCGYVDLKKPDPESIIKKARNLLMVRDGLASFFFHPFVPLRHLRTITREMKKMGWEFVSLTDFPCNCRAPFLWVTSQGTKGSVTLENDYLREIVFQNGERVREEVSPKRQSGVVEKNIQLPPRSMYVLESLDLMPPEEGGERTDVSGDGPVFSPGSRFDMTHILLIENLHAKDSEKCNQESFRFVLTVFGLQVDVHDCQRLHEVNYASKDLVVVPQTAAEQMNLVDMREIVDFVERGGNLVTDGETRLAEELGIRFRENTVVVRKVKDLSIPAPSLVWNPPEVIHPPLTQNARILMKDMHSGAALALIKNVGRGRVLFLSRPFDSRSSFGISRYPYFPLYLRNHLDVVFNFRKNDLEFYFDPGLRQNSNWEYLVKRWKESGVGIVYLAAWHFYPSYRFDYTYFINLCHSQGIAVYAWFELPQVSPLFWDRFPQWREKTVSGKDANVHWRLPINLQNREAREAVRQFMRQVLNDHEWDGVNLAELHYDTNEGIQDPNRFTPMNEDIREKFRRERGFDPIKIFQPGSPYFYQKNQQALKTFLDFRCQLIVDLHKFFLEEMEAVKREKRKNMEVIVTAMDTLNHPELVEYCGLNILDIISLMDLYPFTLQVEDPSRSWVEFPSRYRDFYEVYAKHIKDMNRLMFDINVIERPRSGSKSLPSVLATGTEIVATLYFARLASGRAALYSEYTIQPFDMDILAYVCGPGMKIEHDPTGLLVEAPFSCFFLGMKPEYFPCLDGIVWPFFEKSGICLPAGKHKISFKEKKDPEVRNIHPLVSLNADISGVKVGRNSYRIKYRSSVPVHMDCSSPPGKVTINTKSFPSYSGQQRFILPRGSHQLDIQLSSNSRFVVNELGHFSSWAFYNIGIFSVLVLVSVYVFVRIKK